jgi:erythronate-4-phosphate dehydrogenase
VTAALLADSPVRFVGTATIGCDHVDIEYLRSRDIAFASAPGSNATSVAEYVAAALLRSASARGRSLAGAAIAVIGVGNVGMRVVDKAEALGMRCLLNDPPRQRHTSSGGFVPLGRALEEAEYVTLHVPLETAGVDATVGMAGPAFFERMQPGAVFLNTSRGAVVDQQALADALDAGRVAHAVLDVWMHEPDIDPALVKRAFLATPHIAGYSFDGKVAATVMLFRAVAEWLKQPADIDLSAIIPPSGQRVDLSGPPARMSDEHLIGAAVLAAYDIGADDRALRGAMLQPARGVEFDVLRKHYRRRREFPHTTVMVPSENTALAGRLRRLGFRVEAREATPALSGNVR